MTMSIKKRQKLFSRESIKNLKVKNGLERIER